MMNLFDPVIARDTVLEKFKKANCSTLEGFNNFIHSVVNCSEEGQSLLQYSHSMFLFLTKDPCSDKIKNEVLQDYINDLKGKYYSSADINMKKSNYMNFSLFIKNGFSYSLYQDASKRFHLNAYKVVNYLNDGNSYDDLCAMDPIEAQILLGILKKSDREYLVYMYKNIDFKKLECSEYWNKVQYGNLGMSSDTLNFVLKCCNENGQHLFDFLSELYLLFRKNKNSDDVYIVFVNKLDITLIDKPDEIIDFIGSNLYPNFYVILRSIFLYVHGKITSLKLFGKYLSNYGINMYNSMFISRYSGYDQVLLLENGKPILLVSLFDVQLCVNFLKSFIVNNGLLHYDCYLSDRTLIISRSTINYQLNHDIDYYTPNIHFTIESVEDLCVVGNIFPIDIFNTLVKNIAMNSGIEEKYLTDEYLDFFGTSIGTGYSFAAIFVYKLLKEMFPWKKRDGIVNLLHGSSIFFINNSYLDCSTLLGKSVAELKKLMSNIYKILGPNIELTTRKVEGDEYLLLTSRK